MEEHLNSVAATHLLQHTLRSFCIHDNSQWVYAVFWRILPRNFPPPQWDSQEGIHERSIRNRRNWILGWEDGFCKGLQPEVFFKMSHEIHNYGEGLIGKVAADHSYKWIYKEQSDQEINLLSAWHKSVDSHPRTWEAQFQCGIETIALIAVREGVLQLGALHKIIEDQSYVAQLRKKVSFIESILLPHPFSSYGGPTLPGQPINLGPPMTSLEALLSKLPPVVPGPSSAQDRYFASPELVELAAEGDDDGETGGGVPPYHRRGSHRGSGYLHSSMNDNGC